MELGIRNLLTTNCSNLAQLHKMVFIGNFQPYLQFFLGLYMLAIIFVKANQTKQDQVLDLKYEPVEKQDNSTSFNCIPFYVNYNFYISINWKKIIMTFLISPCHVLAVLWKQNVEESKNAALGIFVWNYRSQLIEPVPWNSKIQNLIFIVVKLLPRSNS